MCVLGRSLWQAHSHLLLTNPPRHATTRLLMWSTGPGDLALLSCGHLHPLSGPHCRACVPAGSLSPFTQGRFSSRPPDLPCATPNSASCLSKALIPSAWFSL